MTEILPDALPTNWVDRHAPVALQPWLKLGRFDRPAGIWLLMLPGWWGVALAGASRGNGPDLVLLIKIFVGAALMRAAGCAFNDIVDRDFDAQVARTAMRPIPSGQITVPQAWAFLLGCCLISFGILVTLPLFAIALGVGSLALVAAYPFMKRITSWPQAVLGLAFAYGGLMGWAAAMGGLAAPAWLIYGAAIAWTVAYDTIYALQDARDDAIVGVRSTARLFGGRVRLGVAGFYGAAVAMALAGVALLGGGVFAYAGIAGFALHLAWQVVMIDPASTAGSLRLFRANRDAGLILFAGLSLQGWLG